MILFFAPWVKAQGTVDIPFVFDEDDHFPVQTPSKPPTPKTPTKPASPKQPPSKPIKFNQPNPEQPNIGSNATEPLKVLEILPPPAPSVTIDLTDSKPQPVQPVKPAKPVNTRVQAIDIQKNTLWKNTTPGAVLAPAISDFTQDVRGFELEGFYLGMSIEEVLALVRENGYQVVSSKDTISKFRTSYYEGLCKNKGIRIPEKIRACISKMSKLNGTTYLSTMKVARPRTREYIEFSFTKCRSAI